MNRKKILLSFAALAIVRVAPSGMLAPPNRRPQIIGANQEIQTAARMVALRMGGAAGDGLDTIFHGKPQGGLPQS